MKKLVLIGLMGVMSLSLSASDLIKTDKEVLHCSSIPSKVWERDKWLANLNDNVIITCDEYLYSAKKKSWYKKSLYNYEKVSNQSFDSNRKKEFIKVSFLSSPEYIKSVKIYNDRLKKEGK